MVYRSALWQIYGNLVFQHIQISTLLFIFLNFYIINLPTIIRIQLLNGVDEA